MSAGSTTVRYGEVTITNCLTKRFEQEAVFDDSGTDLLYYKFTVRVVGYCHGEHDISSVNIQPVSSGGDAARHHKQFRPTLLEPRLNFEMRLGVGIGMAGTVLLECGPHVKSGVPSLNSHNIDLNNGPKARILSITNVSANQLLRVEAEFEICKLECGTGDSESPNKTGVLNNRWSCVDDIDSNFFTTRTFTGRLRLISANINPNSFRDWVVPGLQEGMRRDRMSFTASEDGLHLDYVVVDKEVAFAAPKPATDWKVTHTESLGEHGVIGYAEINVTLAGDRNVDKFDLMKLAVATIESRVISLNGFAVRDGQDDVVLAFSITDSFGSHQQNTISASCQVRHREVGNDALFKGIGKLGRRIEAADLLPVGIDYNRDQSRGGRPGETPELSGPVPLIGAFSAYLQNPCSINHDIQAEVAPTGDLRSGVNKGNPAKVEASVVQEIEDTDHEYESDENKEHFYNYWQMESKYHVTKTKAHLPVASGSVSPGASAPTSTVVSLANGMATRTVRLKGERYGEWPKAPTPGDYTDENGIAAILMDVVALPSVVERAPDSTELFRIGMDITYALSRLPLNTETLRAGYNPWDNLGIHSTNNETFQGGAA